jgi:hypothetical protein
MTDINKATDTVSNAADEALLAEEKEILKKAAIRQIEEGLDKDGELVRLAGALDRCVEENDDLSDILDDPLLMERIEDAVMSGKTAEAAAVEACNAFAVMFAETPAEISGPQVAAYKAAKMAVLRALQG